MKGPGSVHLFFFFKQKTAYEIHSCWSSDVCSSDLGRERKGQLRQAQPFEDALDLDRDHRELLRRPHVRIVVGLQLRQLALQHGISRMQKHRLRIRSEERRVGKEGRYGWERSDEKRK